MLFIEALLSLFLVLDSDEDASLHGILMDVK